MSDIAALKYPPYSTEAEQAVIGGLMLNPLALERVGTLRTEHFFREDHRLIFDACRNAIDDVQTCDVLVVAEKLHRNGVLNQCGGVAYLQSLLAGTPSAANIRLYAQTVQERWQLRTLATSAEEIADSAYTTGGRSPRELIEAAQAKIMSLSDHAGGNQPRRFSDLMPEFNEALRRRASGEIVGIPTGFAAIDKQVQIEHGNLIIVGARPGIGKSAFGSQWGEQAAMAGFKTLIMSMEMNSREIIARALARHSGVMLCEILSGRARGWPAVVDAQARLSKLPILIDDSAPAPIHEVRAKARAMKRRDGLDVLVLDYLQLMPSTGTLGKSRNEDLSDVTRGLKALARELDIVVVALSQLARRCEERPDKRPLLSDLRDSGAIEQDADVVFLGYRHEKHYPSDPDWHGIAEWNVAKYRNGATGVIPTLFDGALTKFSTYTGNWPLTQARRPRTRAFNGTVDDD